MAQKQKSKFRHDLDTNNSKFVTVVEDIESIEQQNNNGNILNTTKVK